MANIKSSEINYESKWQVGMPPKYMPSINGSDEEIKRKMYVHKIY